MTKQHFTFKQIFDFAWVKTQQHAWFMICAFVIYGVILNAVKHTGLFELLVVVLTSLSLLSISLIIARNESFGFSNLYFTVNPTK